MSSSGSRHIVMAAAVAALLGGAALLSVSPRAGVGAVPRLPKGRVLPVLQTRTATVGFTTSQVGPEPQQQPVQGRRHRRDRRRHRALRREPRSPLQRGSVIIYGPPGYRGGGICIRGGLREGDAGAGGLPRGSRHHGHPVPGASVAIQLHLRGIGARRSGSTCPPVPSKMHPAAEASVAGGDVSSFQHEPSRCTRRVLSADPSTTTPLDGLVGGAGAPTRAQQSDTDQQMSFRNRWSSSTSSRIASGSGRAATASSRPAYSLSPSGAPARAALMA